MQLFLYKQNILLLFVIMSFGNFYLFKSYAWIKYMFCIENGLRMFMIKIESYGDINIFVKLET